MAQNKVVITEVKKMMQSLSKIIEVVKQDNENTNKRKARFDQKKQKDIKRSLELLSKHRLEQLGFEFTQIEETPEHLEGKQFFLTKKTA